MWILASLRPVCCGAETKAKSVSVATLAAQSTLQLLRLLLLLLLLLPIAQVAYSPRRQRHELTSAATHSHSDSHWQKSSFVSGSASCGVIAPADDCLVLENEKPRESLSAPTLSLSLAASLFGSCLILLPPSQMLIENSFQAFTLTHTQANGGGGGGIKLGRVRLLAGCAKCR